jgi:hypothetical protein
MLRAARALVVVATAAILCGCAAIADRYFPPLVRPEECAEIKIAIRKVTSSPVRDCSRPFDSAGPTGKIIVWTADGKTYRAEKVGRKWHFHEVVIAL